MAVAQQTTSNAMFHGDLVNSSRILYTASDFAKNNLLYLQEIGHLQARKPHVSKRTDLDSFLFFIVLSGTGKLHYQNADFHLHTGDCIFINCRTSYFHETSNDLWTLKWIHFSGLNMQAIYEKYISRGGQPVFHPTHLDSIEQAWQTIYSYASTTDYVKDMKINEGISSLLTLLMQESWHPEITQQDSKRKSLIQVQAYLDTHYQEQIRLDTLATLFYINKFYLTKVFKKQYDISINQYILEKRITHAKHLLRFTDQSLEQIGSASGFSSPTYFSRTFKKVEGISPNEYRKSW